MNWDARAKVIPFVKYHMNQKNIKWIINRMSIAKYIVD